MSELLPETVQIGPYTYRIIFTEADSARELEFGRASFDRSELAIYISADLNPQRQATWLLSTVIEIILTNMGVNNHGEVAREVAYNLASAWGASPKVVAFIEGGLLKGRPEWEAKIDDDGHEEDWTLDIHEASDAPKREPVDVECDTSHSPMAASSFAHVPDAVRDALGRIGLSVDDAIALGAVEVVNNVVQLTMPGNSFPNFEGPAWNIKTFDCEKFIHFSDDDPDVYWSLENGRAGKVREEEDGRVSFDELGVWAEYHSPLPRMLGQPVRDATGRQYQTIVDEGGQFHRTRVVPHGWHPPQAKG